MSDPSPKTLVSKIENVDPKVPEQSEAKTNGVLNPQNYNINCNIFTNFRSSAIRHPANIVYTKLHYSMSSLPSRTTYRDHFVGLPCVGLSLQ